MIYSRTCSIDCFASFAAGAKEYQLMTSKGGTFELGNTDVDSNSDENVDKEI